MRTDKREIFEVFILFMLMMALVFLTIIASLVLFSSILDDFHAEYYTVEYNCIDDTGGVFKDELCTKEIRCNFVDPSWMTNVFNSPLCEEVEP